MSVRKGLSWIVVKSTPINRTPLLKTLLADRFPEYHFRYIRFNENNFKGRFGSAQTPPDGVVAELKKFQESSLPVFDKLCAEFRRSNIIFILSPKGYQLLNKRRKKKLHENIVVLSELKSLDYLIELPRLIDGVSLRLRLRKENEKLQGKMDALATDHKAQIAKKVKEVN